MVCTHFQDYDLLKSYVSKIQDLEGELLRLKTSNATSSRRFVDFDDDGYGSKNALFKHDEFSSDCDGKAVDISGSTLENLFY